ncbi:NAD-dependent epimerase/dehydratase family protein [Wohlfahrtiimonas chitiniclastica]|uniref:UDP-2-acetamido-2,6-beta-L-arabino-hexul-4-ose reductase n=1 Tax=Wohlfahrtiimonas chitiniclastica TaxID=400946 RepID=UPI001BCF6F1A|nr:NAD-dependent epimerase/dehydratase family protein [Wohlfahrtiimonas chitiniclastica]MBS7834584.1 NAD-dependent epimerase/dehydratase family protein [Wohlfahrtiimonas chitiniclastica]
MNVLVTGAHGFVGKNLVLRLSEMNNIHILTFTEDNQPDELPNLIAQTDFIFHLAGVNRPQTEDEFYVGNHDLTQKICQLVEKSQRHIPIVFSSSIQAAKENPYGISKQQAEDELLNLQNKTNNPIAIYRLPNVFGKWCQPNYNSVVATFCYNIVHDQPIQIHDPSHILNLVYIDDVIESFLSQLNTLMTPNNKHNSFQEVKTQYQMSLGDLAKTIQNFHTQRQTLNIDNVGSGIIRALYATYISYLPTNAFTYPVQKHEDARGCFVEMLKTTSSGQFSYFTAHPGVTRGGHYHHSKTEKFLVIKGTALFKFRHLITNEYYELITTGDTPQIVDTATGWTHDITNIGNDELIVMLWANEVFDSKHPDTYTCPIKNK